MRYCLQFDRLATEEREITSVDLLRMVIKQKGNSKGSWTGYKHVHCCDMGSIFIPRPCCDFENHLATNALLVGNFLGTSVAPGTGRRFIMLLDRIRLFVSVAKHQNLAKTARANHVSASSVCQRLKSLENEFGVKLYKRTNTGIEVTEAGETLLAIASDVLSNFETLKAKFRGKIDAPERLLKVAGTYNPSARHLPTAIATFQRAFSDTRVSFLTSSKAEIEESLHHRQIDIAVIQSPSNSADFVMEPFAVDKLIFFSHPRHPLANKKSLDLLDLNHTAVVIRGERGTTQRFVKELKSRGVTLNVTLRCVSPDAVKAAVRRDVGIGILFYNLVEDELKRKELKALMFRRLVTPVGHSFIAYSKKQPLSPAANEFLSILRSMKDQLATDTRTTREYKQRHRTA